jgi:polyisoprenoid-binding protein YceI
MTTHARFSGAATISSWIWSRLVGSCEKPCRQRLLAIFGCALAFAAVAGAQSRSIDSHASVMSVRVFKAGVFSALGHDHEVSAPIAAGSVDSTARRVELRVTTATMHVRDQEASEKDRAETQKTMLGPEVLDAEHYQEIIFQSNNAEPKGAGSWTVHGTLTLHGVTGPVTVDVREKDGHYVGASRLNFTDFHIQPVKVAGGTIRIKDEVLIEFDIQLAR